MQTLQNPRSSADGSEIDPTTVVEIGAALALATALIVALTRKRTKRVVPVEISETPVNVEQREQRDPLMEQIEEVEDRLAELGFSRWGVKDDLRKWGGVTDLQDILELFKLVHAQALRPVANIHLDKNLSFDATLESIYTQVTGKTVPDGAGREKLFALLKKENFALAITVDPTLDEEIVTVNPPSITQRHRNSDIGIFQNIVRSWEQDQRVPVCAYSENRYAVPAEVGINLIFMGRPRSK